MYISNLILYMVSIFEILASSCLLPAYKNIIDFFRVDLISCNLAKLNNNIFISFFVDSLWGFFVHVACE